MANTEWACYGCSKSAKPGTSHAGKTLKGGEWLGILEFDPHAERKDTDRFYACSEHLQEMLTETKNWTQYDPEEKILQWEYYQCHIPDTRHWRHHYLLFKTKDWWWSVEKNQSGIILQRNPNEEYVRDYNVDTSPRQGVESKYESQESNSLFCTAGALMTHIQRSLKETYNVPYKNCWNWARDTASSIVETKWWRRLYVDSWLPFPPFPTLDPSDTVLGFLRGRNGNEKDKS